MIQQFNTIDELIDYADSQEACVKHLESLRWNGIVKSPFDSNSVVYKCKGFNYRCKNTGKYFNVMTKTLFHNTKIPLQKWFLAIFILETQGYYYSSVELAKQIGTTQKTAWNLIQKIKKCFGENKAIESKNFDLELKRVLKSNNIK